MEPALYPLMSPPPLMIGLVVVGNVPLMPLLRLRGSLDDLFLQIEEDAALYGKR